MKDFLIVANWKQNNVDIANYFAKLELKKSSVVICPDYTNLADVRKFCKNNCFLGAQNVSEFLFGANTGEVSADMLKKQEVSYCIVGHSERRIKFKETNRSIAKKIENLILCNIKPILCVGEKNALSVSSAYKIVKKQLQSVPKRLLKDVVVAYEPIWAIGTKQIPELNMVEAMCKQIKLDYDVSGVLYGGSVDENNFNKFLNLQSVNGLLIGGASLNVEKINKILEVVLWKQQLHW